jgi:hypothetical protein
MQDRLLDNFHYQTLSPGVSPKKPLARHGRCDVYCGARETVGESSVSSGCWGEDSNHEYGWARRTPTYVAPIRFSSEPLYSAPQRPPRTSSSLLRARIRTVLFRESA